MNKFQIIKKAILCAISTKLHNKPQKFLEYHYISSYKKVFEEAITKYSLGSMKAFQVLDVGGGNGASCKAFLSSIPNFMHEYWGLDIKDNDLINTMAMDICKPIDVASDGQQFDIIYSNNAFEHFLSHLLRVKTYLNLLNPVVLCLSIQYSHVITMCHLKIIIGTQMSHWIICFQSIISRR